MDMGQILVRIEGLRKTTTSRRRRYWPYAFDDPEYQPVYGTPTVTLIDLESKLPWICHIRGLPLSQISAILVQREEYLRPFCSHHDTFTYAGSLGSFLAFSFQFVPAT